MINEINRIKNIYKTLIIKFHFSLFPAKVNIAFQKPVTTSSTAFGSSADNAVDGEIDKDGG